MGCLLNFFLKLHCSFKMERNADMISMCFVSGRAALNFQTERTKFNFAAAVFKVRDNNFALVICSDKVNGRDCVNK